MGTLGPSMAATHQVKRGWSQATLSYGYPPTPISKGGISIPLVMGCLVATLTRGDESFPYFRK